ncbi:CD48 antigen-like isoform X2 [Electrophorus electricus]|uniref:Ig-like domain-containing protein n=1 Tax=Electrophorus electricus TaxID=8005 RepID=A0A4W4DXB2_ELEEL|nr:CD48 antigen-like isoform X2 [Electrophorus electricus]
MKVFHGYCVSYSGILLLGIIQGLCVLADENAETVRRASGSSLLLPLGLQKESVSYAQWKFKEHQIARYSKNQIHINLNHQFMGRLKVDNVNVTLEVEALQVQDSGTFSIVVDGSTQIATKFISLIVYARIENVTIQSNQTWLDSIKACDVHLWCQTYEDPTASYTWSGYQNRSGAFLHFTFSPEDGNIILNCTAANNFSNQTASKPLKCSPEPPTTEAKLLIWTAAGAGAALLLLIAVIALSCWWRSHGDATLRDCGNTVYADVNVPQNSKPSQSNINGASIYETVDDLRVTSDKYKPQTLYDKVMFSRPTADCPSPSPYQHVL